MEKNTVLLAMSGGTDSSAAAMLLREQGFQVQGVFISFFDASWAPEHVIANQHTAARNVQELCASLNIPFHHIHASQEFYETVITYFVDEYVAGRTPFPCAVCNPKIKWQMLFSLARELQCYYIATGHYVQIQTHNNLFYIAPGVDPDKDQSFFLWGLSQEILAHTLFPLGTYTKPEVRAYAQSKGYTSIAQLKDSLGICFVGNDDYRPFVAKELARRKICIPHGKHINTLGEYISTNQGYIWYTVGQRRQLGVHTNKRMFVQSIDAAANTVTLGDYASLYRTEFRIHSYYFHTPADMQGELIVKIRYRNQQHRCTLDMRNANECIVYLTTPLEAIAPGQTAVFYKDNRVVGGGFISKNEVTIVRL